MIQRTAESLKTNKAKVFNFWENEFNQNIIGTIESSNYLLLREAFELLFDDFVFYLSSRDLLGYLNACSKLLQRVSRGMDLSFKELMHGFHLFENSVALFVVDNDPSINNPFIILDKLYHYSIGEISESHSYLNDLTWASALSLMEQKQIESDGHIKRTREYVNAIAREFNCNSRFIQDLHRASPLHDLGKIILPDDILCKPAITSHKELSILKTHTTKGA